MEIERKWMVKGWPDGLTPARAYTMDQGYLTVRPTVRIRREAEAGGPTALVLCFKGAPDAAGLAREEIETAITPELFDKLARLIGHPLLRKERRDYPLPGGLTLEVNDVEPGQPDEFFYAEIEFPTLDAARAWAPDAGLASYLTNEVTGQKGMSMGEIWEKRIKNKE